MKTVALVKPAWTLGRESETELTVGTAMTAGTGRIVKTAWSERIVGTEQTAGSANSLGTA